MMKHLFWMKNSFEGESVNQNWVGDVVSPTFKLLVLCRIGF
jgi:hypothetical protein